MQGIAAFFSQDKKKVELVCSPNQKTLTNRNKSDIDHDSDSDSDHYTILVNPIILFGALLFTVGVAFYAGCFVRILLISNSISQRTSTSSSQQNLSLSDVATDLSAKKLPPPTVIPGKDVPPTTYTFKHFPVEGSRTSHDLHLDRSLDGEHKRGDGDMHEAEASKITEDVVEDGEDEDSSDDSSEDDDSSDDDDDEEISDLTEGLHLPAGQHLLVDIKNVDPIFLNSEVRLAEAMIKLVDESKLTLLSYHCQ